MKMKTIEENEIYSLQDWNKLSQEKIDSKNLNLCLNIKILFATFL
jgi:hypothetical protein